MNLFFIFLAVILVLIVAFQFLLITKLLKDVVTDRQTGLKNFRWFEKKVTNLMHKNGSKGAFTPLSIAIIDIDNFRRFNNNGIRVGDEVLFEFSDKLYELVAKITDTKNVVRYRLGDEFALFFEDKSAQQTEEIIKLIADTFRENYLKIPSSPELIYITFGYGIASVLENDSFNSLIERAEQDLVKNKSK